MQRWSRRLMVLGVLAVVGCGASVDASPTPIPVGSDAAPPPPKLLNATPAPSRAPAETSRATGWDAPTVPHWVPIGHLPAYGEVMPWWFSDGYVLLQSEPWDAGDLPTIQFSADGREWQTSELPTTMVVPCPGWTPRPGLEGARGWAAGGGLLIAGMEYTPDPVECGVRRPVVWGTDGRGKWSEKSVVGDSDELGSQIEGLWATPDGWELALEDREERLWLWRSAYGSTWHQVGPITDIVDRSRVVVANDGTRVIAVAPDEEHPALLVSHDGLDWEPVNLPPSMTSASGESFVRFIPPDGGRSSWIVFTGTYDERPVNPWLTDDFVTWERGDFPMPLIEASVQTPESGVLALGTTPCFDTGGGPCGGPSRYLLSRDGVTWTALPDAIGPTTFIEGPEGVLGIGPDEGGRGATVYRLESYSPEESFLLAGARADAATGCAPARDGLPDGAIAGVRCAPDAAVVDQVGFYLFPDQAALLDAYGARVAAEGLTAGSGPCTSTAGEGSYATSVEDADDPRRMACYRNEFDSANFRITYPGGPVYVGVLGAGSGVGRLGEWIRKGGDDAGPPAIWSDPRR